MPFKNKSGFQIFFSGDPVIFLHQNIVFYFDTKLDEKPEYFEHGIVPMDTTSESNDSIVSMYCSMYVSLHIIQNKNKKY